jgi:hypothetical protein
MRVQTEQPRVEVYCNRCRVSFPVGRRRCLHCGGRLDTERRWTEQTPLPPELEFEPQPEVHFEDLGEDEMPRRSGFSPLTLVWIALLLAGYLYRACAS